MMKKLLMGACLMLWAGAVVTGQVAAWDFYGQSFPVSCAATTFDTCLVSASGANLITRGPGAPASGGVHSFRTTGFQNNGISMSNTDYFQVTLTAKPGYKLSLFTLDAKFNGTSTFFTAPGVTSQFAYSLDGTNFFMIGNPVQSTSLTMSQVNLNSINALQNVYSSVTITIRYYASGQTTTGGWGFYSAAAGTNGFSIGGSVVPVTIAPPTIQASQIVFSNSGLNQMSVSWTPGNGYKRIVKINTINMFTPPVNGTDPPANSQYAGSGEQVVYNGDGSTIASVTGLLPGTSYWFRAFDYNGAGNLTQFCLTTATGNPAQGSTSGLLQPPGVTNPTHGNIGSSTATLGGHVVSNGGSPVVERGTVWSTQSPVTLADHPQAEGGTDTGVFIHQRSGLPVATLIHHAAYAFNVIGNSLSAEDSFFTLAIEPSAYVSGFAANPGGTVSMYLTWTPTINDNGGYLILQKPGNIPSAGLPLDAHEYQAGTAIGDASVASNVIGLGYAAATISGLQPGTDYTYTIYPYIWDGIHPETINYLTSPGTPVATGTTSPQITATYHWTGAAGTNWNSAMNWSPMRNIPAPNDILVFDPGGATTITNVISQTIGQLKINSNSVVVFQGSGILDLTGEAGDGLVIDAGSSLTLSGSGVIQLSLAATVTGRIEGDLIFSGAGHRLLSVDPNSVEFKSGSTFKAGTGFAGNPFGTVNLNSIVFESGSTYIALAGGNPFGATAPASVVVFQHGSRYRIDAYHVPSFGGRTYGDFEVNYSGMITATGTSAVSIDHFIASKGSFYFNVTGDPGHSIKGNLYVSGVATLFFSPSSSGTIHFNGNELQTISGTGSIISGTHSKIKIGNASGLVCAMDAEFNDVTIDSGSALEVLSPFTLTVEGDLSW